MASCLNALVLVGMQVLAKADCARYQALSFFYVTIVLLKSDLTVFKFLAVFFLASFYGATYMFSLRTGLEYMPLVQKITHLFQIAWLLGLEYFTRPEDFKRLT